MNAPDLAHDLDDLAGLLLENFEVVAIDLRGELAFDAADGFLHVVGDGLGEIPDDAGDFLQLTVHGRDEFVFILVKRGAPLFLGLQVDEVFGIEETGGVGAVVGASHLAGALGYLGPGAKDEAGLVGHSYADGWAGAGRESSAHPESAFIEMGKELGADDAADGEIDGDPETGDADGDGDDAHADGAAKGAAVTGGEPNDHRVMPLARAVGKEEAGESGSDDDGEDDGSQKREGDGPGHGFEQAPFDALQREDGQVGGDDDGDGVKHRALHFVGGVEDLLFHGAAAVLAAQMANDVFHHDDGPVDDHAEIERAEREEIRGDAFQAEAGGGEQEREGNGEGDDDRAARVAEKEEENDDDEDDAVAEIVENGVGGEFEEVAAVDEGDDFDAGGKDVTRSSRRLWRGGRAGLRRRRRLF